MVPAKVGLLGNGNRDIKTPKRFIDLTHIQQRQIDEIFLFDRKRSEQLFRDMERGKLGPEWKQRLEQFRSKTAAEWPLIR